MRKSTVVLTNAAIVVTAAGIALVTPVTTRAASAKSTRVLTESLVGIEMCSDSYYDSIYKDKVSEVERKIIVGEVSAEEGVRLIHQIEDQDKGNLETRFKSLNLRYSMDDLAEFLNLSQEELRRLRIAEKMSILEIADEQGVSEKKLKDFLIKEHLELIKGSNLQEFEKDELTSKFIENLDTLINFKPGEFNGKMSQNFQSKIPLI